MTTRTLLATGLLLTLSACAPPAVVRPSAAAKSPTWERVCEFTPVPDVLVAEAARATPGAALLKELARVAALSPEQRRRELAALEDGRRLDDDRRFQLAALLEREDTNDALERSLKQLSALTGQDESAQALLELMKRSLRMRLELRQQNARVQELQDRIEQIKALEKSLQQRNVPPRTP